MMTMVVVQAMYLAITPLVTHTHRDVGLYYIILYYIILLYALNFFSE